MFRPRRRTVVAVSLAAALAAGVTTAVVTSDTDGRGVTALPSLDEPAATTGGPEPTETASETATPSPTPTPAESSPAAGDEPAADETTTPEPASPGSTSGGSPPQYGDFGPRPPGSVTAPYRAGQTSWDVTSGGIRIRVTMTPAKVGEPVTWTVHTSSAEADCCATFLLYGDGYGSSPNGLPCDSPAPSLSRQHTYNGSGRREFMVQAETKKCQGSRGIVYGAFDVAPGQSTAQGPELPTARFDNSTPVKGHENDHRYVSLWGEAEDEDGHITKLVVDFGDGTSKTFDPRSGPCRETRDGWPGPSLGRLPYDPPAYHYYRKPGSYTLTLTAYSAGCDGTMVQKVKRSFVWHVPAPEPSESPTPSPTASPTPSPTPS